LQLGSQKGVGEKNETQVGRRPGGEDSIHKIIVLGTPRQKEQSPSKKPSAKGTCTIAKLPLPPFLKNGEG